MARRTSHVAFPLASMLLVLLGLFACHSKSGGTLTATVSYREPIALPGDAVFEARLVDLSAKPGEKRVLAETRVAPVPSMPLSFALNFDPGAIKDIRAYGVEAEIRVQNETWFSTPLPVPVLTQGHPDKLDIVLHRGAGPRSEQNSESAAGAIDRRLPRLTRLEGTFSTDGMPASYIAYLERGQPVLIREGHQESVEAGSAAIAFYYKDGALIRYEEDGVRREKSGLKQVVAVVLNFADGSYTGGKKTVNGAVCAPDPAEIAAAQQAGEAAKARITARLKAKSAVN